MTSYRASSFSISTRNPAWIGVGITSSSAGSVILTARLLDAAFSVEELSRPLARLLTSGARPSLLFILPILCRLWRRFSSCPTHSISPDVPSGKHAP